MLHDHSGQLEEMVEEMAEEAHVRSDLLGEMLHVRSGQLEVMVEEPHGHSGLPEGKPHDHFGLLGEVPHDHFGLLPCQEVLPPAQAMQEAPILSDDHFDQYKVMAETWCAKQNPLATCRQP